MPVGPMLGAVLDQGRWARRDSVGKGPGAGRPSGRLTGAADDAPVFQGAVAREQRQGPRQFDSHVALQCRRPGGGVNARTVPELSRQSSLLTPLVLPVLSIAMTAALLTRNRALDHGRVVCCACRRARR